MREIGDDTWPHSCHGEEEEEAFQEPRLCSYFLAPRNATTTPSKLTAAAATATSPSHGPMGGGRGGGARERESKWGRGGREKGGSPDTDREHDGGRVEQDGPGGQGQVALLRLQHRQPTAI